VTGKLSPIAGYVLSHSLAKFLADEGDQVSQILPLELPIQASKSASSFREANVHLVPDANFPMGHPREPVVLAPEDQLFPIEGGSEIMGSDRNGTPSNRSSESLRD